MKMSNTIQRLKENLEYSLRKQRKYLDQLHIEYESSSSSLSSSSSSYSSEQYRQRSTQACLKILKSVADFLSEWEQECRDLQEAESAESEEKEDSLLPSLLIKRALSQVVSELGGSGNSKFRNYLWGMLQSDHITTVEGRQIILDFIPATLPPPPPPPPEKGEAEDDNDNDMSLNEDLSEDLLSIFQPLCGVNANPEDIEPILECLSRLVVMNRISSTSFFIFLIDPVMKKVPETCLPVIPKILVKHMENNRKDLDSSSNKEEAINTNMVIEAFRHELASLEESELMTQRKKDQCVIPLVESIIKSSLTGRNGPRFLRGYVDAIVDELDSHREESSSSTTSPVLSLYDVIVLILSFDEVNHHSCDQVKEIFDEALMMNNKGLDPVMWSRLLRICIGGGNEEDNSSSNNNNSNDFVRTALLEPMLSLSIFLLLAPVRNRNLMEHGDNDSMKALLKRLILVLNNDKTQQQHLISQLFGLVDQIEAEAATTSENFDEFQAMHFSIFDIFATIARTSSSDVLKPYQDRFIGKFSSLLSHPLYDEDVVNTLGSIVVSLDSDSRGFSSTTYRLSNSVETVRSLLYSCTFLHDDNKYERRSIRGMVLAITIVSSSPSPLGNDDKMALWRLVRPFLTTSSIRLSKDPSLNLHVVKFLSAIHGWAAMNSIISERDFSSRVVEKDAYHVTKRMFEVSNVVQRYSKFKEDGVASLEYTTIPSLFERTLNEGNRYYFSFRRVIKESDPWFAKCRADWIFELTRTYLSLSRARNTNWEPDTWLEASFEFPYLDVSKFKKSLTTRRQREALEFLNAVIRDTELANSSAIKLDGSEKEFFEALKSLKHRSDVDEFLQHLLQFSISLTLGLSMSAAVLQNSWAHFKQKMVSYSLEREEEEKAAAVRLLQFQIFKICNMVDVCDFVVKVFRSIGTLNRSLTSSSKKRKRSAAGDQENDDKMQRAIEQGSKQLRESSQLYLSACVNQTEALWLCLVEPNDDKLIVDSIPKLKDSSLDSEACSSLLQIVNLRLNIINHVISVALNQSGDGDDTIEKSLALTRPEFLARCLRLCAYLSLNHSQHRRSYLIDQDNESIKLVLQELSTLTASSFLLLYVSMVKTLESVAESEEDETLKGFFLRYVSILGAKDPMKQEILSVLPGSSSDGDKFNQITGAFLNHIRDCDDASIACQLIETWSVFALRYGKGSHNMMADITLTWSPAIARYSVNETKCFEAPHIFRYALDRLLPLSLSPKTRKNAVEQAVHDTVVKLALLHSKNQDKGSFWVNSLCRHWGLLVLLMERGDDTIYYHLAQLFSSLEHFFQKAGGSEAPRSLRKKRCNDVADGDGDYIPPKDKPKVKSSRPALNIDGIDFGTFPVIFDTLLRIAVATASVISIDWDANFMRTGSPYTRFESFLRFFGSIISLCQLHVSVFPTKTLSAILNTSRSMVDTSTFQMNRFVEWRSNQPMPEIKDGEGENDPASVDLIAGLFDSIQVNVVGRLQSLCDQLDNPSDSSSSSGGGAGCNTRNLRSRVKKLRDELLRVATLHSLSPPGANVQQISPPLENETDKTILYPFGTLEFLESQRRDGNEDHLESERGRTKIASSRRVIRNDDKNAGDDASNSQNSSVSGSFGAEGDWGDEKNDHNESKDNRDGGRDHMDIGSDHDDGEDDIDSSRNSKEFDFRSIPSAG